MPGPSSRIRDDWIGIGYDGQETRVITSPLRGLIIWLLSLPLRILAEAPQLLAARPTHDRAGLRVEEHERDGWLEMRVEAPGIDPTCDVDLTASRAQLSIGVRRAPKSGRNGTFEHSVSLPEDANPVDITTTYDSGTLFVWVPLSGSAPSIEQPVSLPVTY